MCTLSFLPATGGYIVAMNRDELLTRGAAEPPAVHDYGVVRAIFPTDVEGGTWIAATDQGDTWALLNRNGGRRSPRNVSRGQLILGAIAVFDPASINAFMSEVGLFNFLPFRLVGISLARREVHEWTWDGLELKDLSHGWRANHWFSSGISDLKATQSRGSLVEAAWTEPGAGSPEWLRRTHRSHLPAPGAFSICVHRDDAATVSYTEIEVAASEVQMRYQPGSPCAESAVHRLSIPLAPPRIIAHSL